ncbi:MAG: SusC/RagA family TonB-linked outer membrane protein, partial [Prevotella sp.]|nr:SusC/RagA family TonB-linked outer membrane protein [Prevotella sp.]
HQTQYNASVSGGSKDFKFNVGFNHNDEKSIMMGSGYSKNNVNAKINANLNKWIALDFNGRLAFTKLDGLNGGADTNESNAANSIVANTVRWAPVETLTSNNDDEDEENSTSTRRTPYQRINATYKYQERLQQNYNLGLNWKPWKGFTFRTEYGYGWRNNETDQVWGSDATTNSKYGYNGAPQAQYIRTNIQNWRNANTVTYDNNKLFGGRDHINVMVGQEWSSTKQTSRTSTSVGYPTDMTTQEVLANPAMDGIALANEGRIEAKETLLSYFGRINYTLADKYLATFTLRADGSSKFGENNKWGFFPALALAWRMSEENFLKDVRWLDNLKARLSFGTAGNNRIPAGQYNLLYTVSSTSGKSPFFNEERATMLQHSTYLPNPNLKWETTITRNFGLDFGFFRSRINGTLDFYWNTTKDLLMRSGIPTSTGYEYQYQNFGETSNKGVELTLNAVILQTKDVDLNFNFNISYNRNKIEDVALDNPWQSSNWAGSTLSKYEDFRIEAGGRLGEVWGYKQNGYYTVYDTATGTGDLIYNGRAWEFVNGTDNSYTLFGGNLYPGVPKVQVDENGDPIKQRLGNTIAPTTGGFGFDGRIKNFDFNIFMNYSIGGKLINGTKLANSFYSGSARNYNLVDDFRVGNRYTWIDPNTGLNLGRPSASTLATYGGAEGLMARLNEINQGANMYNPCGVTTMQMFDYALENSSFLRLQNVTIGYTLPKRWVNSIYIQNIRIYATGYNLLTFTGYDGYDPEVDTSSKNNPMCPGVDYAAYPKSRSYVLGVNVTF